MSDLLTTALKGAVAAVAARPDVPLAPADAAKVADALAQQLPPPAALEPLWPQLVRYGISIAGTALAAHGIGAEADWQALSGILIAAGPPIWRILSTAWARRKT